MLCSVEGCLSDRYCLGRCIKHYERYKKHGDDKMVLVEQHGMYGTPEYNLWHAIRQRCHNSKSKDYRNYGGRGIRVCYKWRKSFQAFYDYVGPRPSPQHSLDRIDNNRGYEPGNVRWATRSEQAENRRSLAVSGERYISWCRQTKKWAVRIRVTGKNRNFGRFTTIEAATARRDEVLNGKNS